MADEEKEKAEKLAAAKKRFEQLKKEQQKKGKKSGTKKKDAKSDDATGDGASADAADEAVDADKDGDDEDTAASQSKPRTGSFRSPGAEVQELYRKQVSKIEDLEKENKSLKQQNEDDVARVAKLEEELESLREGSSDVAELRSKAKEVDRLKDELTASQRQLVQAQQAAKAPPRKSSSANPEIAEQLASKTTTIETLELEISNLRNGATTLENTLSERNAKIEDLEERVRIAEAASASIQQELDALRVSIAFPSDETQAASADPEALTKRITVLESDVRSANSQIDAAAQRATSLEQKIEALTKLHRDATAASQAKDTELGQLRDQLRRRDRPSHVRDASDFELGEEETETGALQARIRALEAETFDLRRGIWRDQRAALQPGMHEDEHGQQYGGNGGMLEYEDVDLNTSPGMLGGVFGGRGERGNSFQQQRHSTFQDVITSGISAFTGRSRDAPRAGAPAGPPGAGHERKQSLGLLSDDGFDEDAFRLAQEEDAKRRIERVKEVKRGLEQWRGWRLDIADLRRNGIGGGREVGPVFEM